MNIEQNILAVIEEYSKTVTTHTPEGKTLLIQQVHHAANELLGIATKLRETTRNFSKSKDWRLVDGIKMCLLSAGQQYSSFLFSAGLREKITDLIELSYGISFSGLGVYREVVDNSDGKQAFVLYDPTKFERHDPVIGYTLAKDGKHLFVSRTDFYKNFTPKA